jgi:hypothetical protein
MASGRAALQSSGESIVLFQPPSLGRQAQKIGIELSDYLNNARSKLSETVKPG